MPAPSPHVFPGAKPTQREMDSLAEYVLTTSVKESAHNLSMSESTFKGHLVNLRYKLRASSTVQLVFFLREELAEHRKLANWDWTENSVDQ